VATPVRVAAIDFCINVAVSLCLMRWLGVPGLVIASTTAIIAQTFLLGRALVRKMPVMHFGPLVPSLLKVLAATAVMASVVAAGQGLVPYPAEAALPLRIASVAGLVALGVVSYGVALWGLKIEGRQELASVLGRVPGLRGLLRRAL